MSVTTVVAEISEAIQVIKAFKELRTEIADVLGLGADDSILDAIKEIRAAISGTSTVAVTAPVVLTTQVDPVSQ